MCKLLCTVCWSVPLHDQHTHVEAVRCVSTFLSRVTCLIRQDDLYAAQFYMTQWKTLLKLFCTVCQACAYAYNVPSQLVKPLYTSISYGADSLHPHVACVHACCIVQTAFVVDS